MDSSELQKRQSEYDDKYWQHNDLDGKIRHITLHMGKLVGKLSEYCERREHGVEYPLDKIRDEVVPDLIIYGLQLANLLSLDIAQSYIKRIEDNVRRLHSK